jgi:hypothetical protein
VLPEARLAAVSIPESVQFELTSGDNVVAVTVIEVERAEPKLNVVEAEGAKTVPTSTVVDPDGKVTLLKVRLYESPEVRFTEVELVSELMKVKSPQLT